MEVDDANNNLNNLNGLNGYSTTADPRTYNTHNDYSSSLMSGTDQATWRTRRGGRVEESYRNQHM